MLSTMSGPVCLELTRRHTSKVIRPVQKCITSITTVVGVCFFVINI